jgi:hypothetical protein
MPHWLPAGVELQTDVSPARWVVDALAPWRREGVRVRSLLPAVFDAYLRVFHPASGFGHRAPPIRWADLARRRGLELSADITYFDLVGAQGVGEEHLGIAPPLDGQLPGDVCAALRDALEPRTSTPSDAWYWLWDGYGSLWSNAHGQLASNPASRAEQRRLRAEGRDHDRRMEAFPRIRTENRTYFLMRGSVRSVCELEVDGWEVLPNLWHPDDRTWCVVTEIDGYSTYVGATREAVEAVRADPRIESVSVTADAPLDPGPYAPRWRSPYGEQRPG